MPTAIGVKHRGGFQREAIVSATLWPSAQAVALTALLPLLPTPGNDGIQKAGLVTTTAPLAAERFDVLHAFPEVAPPLIARYQGLEHLWACAFGHMPKRIGSTVLPETLATGAYRHLYEVDTRLSSLEAWTLGDGFQLGTELLLGQRKVRRGTFALDDQVSVREWLSSMVQGLTMQSAPAATTLTADLVAYSLSRASGINTAATMALLPPNISPRLNFVDCVIRLDTFSASIALSSADQLQCSSLAVRIDNNLVTATGPLMGLAPEEFERERPTIVTLTLSLPRHTIDTWLAAWGTNPTLMADVKFTGPLIGATGFAYQCNLYFPSLKVTNAQLLPGFGPLSETVQLVAITPTAQPAGMPTLHRLTSCAAELVSGVSAHALL